MQKPSLPLTGCCRCGRLQFEISVEPLLTGACHCTGCQRMTGSAFSLTATVPEEGFRVTKGKPAIGGIHGDTRHYHCDYCMSWAFTRPPEGTMPFVNVRATLFDDAQWFKPFIESYTSESLPWSETAADYSYEKFPSAEDYEGLIQKFADSAWTK